MSQSAQTPRTQDRLVSYFWSGDAVRSRSVGAVVLSGTVNLPVLPPRLVTDWQKEVSVHLELKPGEVEALPLARARARWLDYRHVVQAVADWTSMLGFPDLLASCDVALMACRGAIYHHDGAQYGSAAFCNVFLREDSGLDLHFPAIGQRIALSRGTVVVFDTGQPHAVIKRHSSRFNAGDFSTERDCSQVFLTWELPVENDAVAQALEVTFDVDPVTASLLREEQVWHNGARASVCPTSGRWCQDE